MSHETKTETFFAHGIENYGNFHGNYLNFGLWSNGITKYEDAAENLLTKVAEKIKLDKNSILLDVACGMGSQDLFFMRKFQCKSIEALDLTKKHIDLANSRNNFKNINYVVGNACNLPYNDGQFTHVTGIEGPVNFNTREKFFQEAYRILKPNGRIGLADFCLRRKPKNLLEKKFLEFCAWLWHIPMENADIPEAYKIKLERSGFTEVKIEEVSNYVYPGYVKEQFRYETRKSMYKIRGHFVAGIGLFIDLVTYLLYKWGLIGYIIVSAKKKI